MDTPSANPLAQGKPIETVMDKGCICPFTFADKSEGYSVYDAEGVRKSKHKFKPDENIDKVAEKMGVPIKMTPPGANQRKGARPNVK